ncbi:glutamine--fructose-6-phosphate transaminase (isomerizing) [Candidatus Dependentiae bacterium]|nr:glutamine--fructose-6-phosphate transaminase (isomerizing) [Candidatus Dependentiae bacterium]MBA3752269.1 glutamine--fructose-6-phosphate transaminase (isomerizing) [Candidatus Dependentiae bacterium]
MCSVVGYVGKNLSRAFVIEGLTRLEYRGYDSAGFACIHSADNSIMYTKSQGGISNLLRNFETFPIDGYVGMGHTRWSTHGAASVENAHPHFDCNKKISIVHNGIIENFHELKKMLQKQGHQFKSQTDTETVAHLFESLLKEHKNLKSAVLALVNLLEGAYAFTLMLADYPSLLVVVRKRSPVCIGKGEDEMFIASDLLAFAGKTNKVLFLPDECYAFVTRNSVELNDFNGVSLPVYFQVITVPWTADLKGGHEHFMLKEIYEQKKVIQDTVHNNKADENYLWKKLGLTRLQVQDLQVLKIVGCGTSWHAARVAQFFFESIANVRTEVFLASELRYQPFFKETNSVAVAISQSGETADTLEAIRFLRQHGMHTLAVVNVVSSTMVRETQGYLPIYAGPEVSVASTKAFSAQVAALYWLAHKIAFEKELITERALNAAENELLVVAEILESTIEKYKNDIIKKHAERYAQAPYIIFLGRHVSYPFALEAALKLKELSYIFAEGFPAAELKHGPLALVDTNVPVIIFSVLDPVLYPKLVANAQEVKARGAHLVAFAFEGQQELIQLADVVFTIPHVNPLLGPLAMTGLMQFFVYEISRFLGRPIDKPRNLAKSVTVE